VRACRAARDKNCALLALNIQEGSREREATGAEVPVVSPSVLQMAHAVPVVTPKVSLEYWAGRLAARENRTVVSCRKLAIGGFWVRAAERPGLRIAFLGMKGVEQQGPAFHLATVVTVRRFVARLREREEEGGKRGKKSQQSNDTSWPDPPFPAGDGAIKLLKIFIVKLLRSEKRRR